MVKLAIAFRMKAGLDAAEFRRLWCVDHARMVSRLAPILGIHRYVQSLNVNSELVAQMAASRGWSGTFDGIAEIYWPSEEALAAAVSSIEGQAAFAELGADEARFCDPSTVIALLIEENVVIGD